MKKWCHPIKKNENILPIRKVQMRDLKNNVNYRMYSVLSDKLVFSIRPNKMFHTKY
ncbi:MAG: hypothetical protein ACI9XJ_000433 [Marivirga sp.]|jgi:hypothetical protein